MTIEILDYGSKKVILQDLFNNVKQPYRQDMCMLDFGVGETVGFTELEIGIYTMVKYDHSDTITIFCKGLQVFPVFFGLDLVSDDEEQELYFDTGSDDTDDTDDDDGEICSLSCSFCTDLSGSHISSSKEWTSCPSHTNTCSDGCSSSSTDQTTCQETHSCPDDID